MTTTATRYASPACGALLALAAGTWLLHGSDVRAESGRAKPAPAALPSIAAAAASEHGPGRDHSLVLIGPSGQIYEASGPATWTRRYLGGVATDIAGAVRTETGEFYVAGRRTPFFRIHDKLWHVYPLPNRGRAILPAPASAPVLAIGRHVYIRKTQRWQRLASARTAITAVWAEPGRSPKVIAAAESSRMGWIDKKGNWRLLRHSLGPGDPVVALVGRPGHRTYAIASGGRVLEVRSRTARVVTVGSSAAGFSARMGAVDGSGVLWLVGARIASGAADPQPALARLAPRGSKRQPSGFIDIVQPLDILRGKELTVLHAARDGGLILATKDGLLRVRAPDGSWQTGKILDAPSGRQPSPSGASPARTK